jgi:hypothetical protein
LLQRRILKAAQRLGLREREREKNQSTNAVSQSINPRKQHIESLQRFQREQSTILASTIREIRILAAGKDFSVKHKHAHTHTHTNDTPSSQRHHPHLCKIHEFLD